ncbi:oligosaccharide flippase family protein [Bacillus sp. ISL-37]|uniref:lipopolysaccharide biosynthesis protein n=1 Tax=Bacillus sp. ISL-37 TaxID=2819123 RepID=UPI001BE658B5|nr:oligosaccharide flippase family protein [Bacillus sp. ISL-37]MBT2686424.1 oligosaccharide flippase family protein [Bacillus sp. ISL-37]
MVKKFILNDFNKNVIKLMTGSTIAQAIPVAASPILTRIYSPEQFGVLALFVAITSIFSAIVNGRYEFAIMLPDKDEDAVNILALSLLIALSVSTLLFLVILLFQDFILSILGNNEIKPWLFFIPLVVLMSGIYNALNFMNTRIGSYGVIAKANVIKAVVGTTFQIILGLLKAGILGLIGGQIISHFVSNYRMVKEVIRDKTLLNSISKSKIKRMAFKYKRFPLVSSWATLCNVVSVHSTSIFLSMIYSASTLGFYSLINKVLNLPMIVVSRTISQVFFQQASVEKRENGKAIKTFKSTFIKLLIISLLGFGPLFFFIEDLVIILFGEQWADAGKYAQFLIPLMLIKFVVSPLTSTLIIYEKQVIDLYWQVVYLLLSIGIFGISYILGFSIYYFFIFNTLVLSIHYLIILFIAYRLVRST